MNTETPERHPLPESVDPAKNPEDVVAVTVLYNKKTSDTLVVWPNGSHSLVVLLGMLQYALQNLAEQQIVPKVAKGLAGQLQDQLARMPSGGKLIVPSVRVPGKLTP